MLGGVTGGGLGRAKGRAIPAGEVRELDPDADTGGVPGAAGDDDSRALAQPHGLAAFCGLQEQGALAGTAVHDLAAVRGAPSWATISPARTRRRAIRHRLVPGPGPARRPRRQKTSPAACVVAAGPAATTWAEVSSKVFVMVVSCRFGYAVSCLSC